MFILFFMLFFLCGVSDILDRGEGLYNLVVKFIIFKMIEGK